MFSFNNNQIREKKTYFFQQKKMIFEFKKAMLGSDKFGILFKR